MNNPDSDVIVVDPKAVELSVLGKDSNINVNVSLSLSIPIAVQFFMNLTIEGHIWYQKCVYMMHP